MKFFAIKIIEGANVLMSEQHDIIRMYSYYYHSKMLCKEQLKQQSFKFLICEKIYQKLDYKHKNSIVYHTSCTSLNIDILNLDIDEPHL